MNIYFTKFNISPTINYIQKKKKNINHFKDRVISREQYGVITNIYMCIHIYFVDYKFKFYGATILKNIQLLTTRSYLKIYRTSYPIGRFDKTCFRLNYTSPVYDTIYADTNICIHKCGRVPYIFPLKTVYRHASPTVRFDRLLAIFSSRDKHRMVVLLPNVTRWIWKQNSNLQKCKVSPDDISHTIAICPCIRWTLLRFKCQK